MPEQDLGTIDLHMGQQKTQTPCQKVYQRACAKLGVRPCTNVHDSLPQPKMALPHNGVGQQQVKAVAIALVVSTRFSLESDSKHLSSFFLLFFHPPILSFFSFSYFLLFLPFCLFVIVFTFILLLLVSKWLFEEAAGIRMTCSNEETERWTN